jgi:tetrathionate reductase subunit C
VVYTGAEIMVIRSRPLWNTLWVPINLALSGWLATVGMGFVLYRFLPRALQPDAAALHGLRHLGLWLATGLIASALTWGIAGIAGQSLHLTWRCACSMNSLSGASPCWARPCLAQPW